MSDSDSGDAGTAGEAGDAGEASDATEEVAVESATDDTVEESVPEESPAAGEAAAVQAAWPKRASQRFTGGGWPLWVAIGTAVALLIALVLVRRARE